MFTGIIINLGKLIKKEGSVFIFDSDQSFCRKLSIGASIAVNGACLTVSKKPTSKSFAVEIMPETEEKTNIKYLKTNDLVNLELPVTPSTLLSGHILQGHIDEVSKVLDINLSGNSKILKLSISNSLAKYLVEKGSIAVNGISLTIIKAEKNYFTVGIIPYTWDNTMLKLIKVGDLLNIEVDVLAKYVEKLLK